MRWQIIGTSSKNKLLGKKRISALVIKNLFGTLSNKKLTIYGFAFKANTNDTRESPSINISKYLLQEGSKLNFYDPKVNQKQIFNELDVNEEDGNVLVYEDPYKAVEGADAVLILTEWNEFKFFNWEAIYKVMRKPSWIFDSRISLDQNHLKKIGFKVWTLGTE